MNKTHIILLAISLLTFSACEKVTSEQMTVVRDCTGTYLRYQGKDYQVCNLEKVSEFPDGTPVKVTFEKIDNCTGSAITAIVCEMLHQNEGWIEVKNIK